MISDITLKGVLIGFSTAMPVGAIAILCIRRTLAGGFFCGVVSGFGSATADALYSAIATSGLTVLQSWLLQHQIGIELLSGLLFCGVGWQFFRMVPVVRSPEPLRKSTLLKHYFSMLLMTLADPLPILFFMVLLAGSGGQQAHPLCPIQMSLGVFLGAMLWWTVLSGFCQMFRSQLSEYKMQWLNHLSGGIITSFGLVMLGQAIGIDEWFAAI